MAAVNALSQLRRTRSSGRQRAITSRGHVQHQHQTCECASPATNFSEPVLEDRKCPRSDRNKTASYGQAPSKTSGPDPASPRKWRHMLELQAGETRVLQPQRITSDRLRADADHLGCRAVILVPDAHRSRLQSMSWIHSLKDIDRSYPERPRPRRSDVPDGAKFRLSSYRAP